VFLAFSTADPVPHNSPRDLLPPRPVLAEDRIDRLFLACAETTRDAVLDALMAAETMTGRASHRRLALRDRPLVLPSSRR
jgi:D-aminopeptidase